MENLWKKESRYEDALYIDIFRKLNPGRRCIFFENGYRNLRMTGKNIDSIMCFEKNAKRSLFYRKSGDAEFKQSNWSTAMKYYNRSLCYAKVNSVDVGIAYAKRAQCFYQMKMYDKCLIDLDLARFSNYPKQHYALLKMRETECMKLIADGAKSMSALPKLSLEPNTNYPEMVNALKIGKNNGKWQLIARADIKTGQIVMVEKSFVTTYTESYQKCCICALSYANLVPCHQCSSVLMCPECNGSILHQVECDAEVLFDGEYASCSGTFRSVLLAMTMFDDADGLIDFVEPIIAGDLSKIPSSVSDQMTKYRAFLYLAYDFDIRGDSSMAFLHFSALMSHPIVSEYFHTEKHCRFLMHLIFHHLTALKFRSVNTCMMAFDNATESTDYAFLLTTNFIHSCAPHITLKTIDGHAVLVTVRPVKKGQHIQLSLDELMVLKAVEDRQSDILENFGFKCNCERCKFEMKESEISTVDEVMLIDRDFKFIAKHLDKNASNHHDDLDEISDCSESFLNKFGHAKWNDFLDMIFMCYFCSIRKKYDCQFEQM